MDYGTYGMEWMDGFDRERIILSRSYIGVCVLSHKSQSQRLCFSRVVTVTSHDLPQMVSQYEVYFLLAEWWEVANEKSSWFSLWTWDVDVSKDQQRPALPGQDSPSHTFICICMWRTRNFKLMQFYSVPVSRSSATETEPMRLILMCKYIYICIQWNGVQLLNT